VQTLTLTRDLLYALQNAECATWSAIAADDVLVSCPAGFAIRGRDALEAWAVAVARALRCAIELADEHLALDERGDGRGFVTLRCKFDREALNLADRTCGWTSSETLLLTVAAHRLVRIYIAGETLDLALRCMPLLSVHHARGYDVGTQ
jgi:hypothetical protein